MEVSCGDYHVQVGEDGRVVGCGVDFGCYYVCNMLFPKIKGTVTALVMIASSLCNYTILTAASKMQPSQVMVMNIVLTTIGVVLGLFVNLRYTSMVEQAQADN